MLHSATGACADSLTRSAPASFADRWHRWGGGLWALLFDTAALPSEPERLDDLDARSLRDIGWWCVGSRRADHENLASHRIDFFL
ncbi:hypothetical protein [Paucibacter sp. XJ19-41]|uniref:hypothetical protein n=1 Tax=Paucibacter sp. XJ19-41 TaxID=2927824 RepID=UPI00234A9CEB|nr:hypothetical protein [Paucibacter sp. XJ19-41]MDC6166898.1 hypothetical protein [Paucibacter sp. XJ19-41]